MTPPLPTPTITIMKEVTVTPKAKASSSKKESKKEYLEIRVPRLSFKNTPVNVYLVFTLVIFAFLLGMLTNKVIYMEKLAKAPVPTLPQAAEQEAQAAPPAFVEVDSGKLPLLGDKDAKVTIVEFSDFQCPYCKKYIDETHSQINDEYIKTGKVKFAYRHYPLSFHPNAPKAGEASECANEQGKFWEYHDILFSNQDAWSPQEAVAAVDSFTGYAGELGLDAEQFRSCLDSGKYKANVDADFAAGGAAQVDGTPTFFVNGNRIVGAVPFSDLQTLIEAELKK